MLVHPAKYITNAVMLQPIGPNNHLKFNFNKWLIRNFRLNKNIKIFQMLLARNVRGNNKWQFGH